MRTYETTVLVPTGALRADNDGTIAAVKKVYETEGAEFIEFDKWMERKLAYPIKGETSAVFFIGYFKADNEIITAIERRAGLSEVILRQLIIARDGKSLEAIKDQRAQAAEKAAAAAAAAAAERED